MSSSISVGATSSNLVDVPIEPDSITWGLQDVSASDAGRVDNSNATMYKMRVTQKRKMQLSWTNPTFSDASTILQMFNPEYIYVKYKDPLTGGWATKQFYVGDRSSPFRQITLSDPNGKKTVMSTLSFDIIER